VSNSTQCELFIGDGKKYTVFGVTYSFKEFKMVRNKHHEDSTDGKDSNNGLEAMIWSVGLQEDHLNEGFFSNTCKTNCATTLRTNLKWTFSSKVWKYLYFNQIYCLFKLTFSSRGITLVLKMLAF